MNLFLTHNTRLEVLKELVKAIPTSLEINYFRNQECRILNRTREADNGFYVNRAAGLGGNAQLMEYPCIEFAEEFLYGHVRKNQLVKHWEGETMIIDVKRKVPERDKFFDWYRK